MKRLKDEPLNKGHERGLCVGVSPVTVTVCQCFVSAVAEERIIKESLGYGHMSPLPFVGPTSIHYVRGVLGPHLISLVFTALLIKVMKMIRLTNSNTS